MAKTRGSAKAKVKGKARARGKSARGASGTDVPIPSSATVRYTRHSRWTRWTKSDDKWLPKLVRPSEVPARRKRGARMSARALIPCSDTVTYVQLASGWVRRTRIDNYSVSDPVDEDDVPENCK